MIWGHLMAEEEHGEKAGVSLSSPQMFIFLVIISDQLKKESRLITSSPNKASK